MKTKVMTLLALGGLLVAASITWAAVEKDQTITGDAACGKCLLKETKNCQLTVTTEADGKKVTYYIVANNVAKEFGHTLCTEQKKVKATGLVNVAAGKHMLIPTRIELVN